MMNTTPIHPGSKLRCEACGAAVIVIRGTRAGGLACGGSPLVASGADAGGGSHDPGTGTLIGKRYVDEAGGVEVLCTSAGTGDLSVDGVMLTVKDAKPLPASD